MAQAKKDLKKKLHCNGCQQKTNHLIKAEHKVSSDKEDYFSWCNEYYIMQCMGCDSISFLDQYGDEEMQDYTHEGEVVFYTLDTVYPPRIARQIPSWFNELKEEKTLLNILTEVYTALQNNLSVLATQGTRTALDIVMTKKIGNTGGFAKRVDAFIAAGYLQKDLRQTLLDVLDAGSAAAHRGYQPDEQEISEIFDLVEGIIHAVYIMPKKAEKVKAKTPQKK